jgi:hypothetical protein
MDGYLDIGQVEFDEASPAKSSGEKIINRRMEIYGSERSLPPSQSNMVYDRGISKNTNTYRSNYQARSLLELVGCAKWW